MAKRRCEHKPIFIQQDNAPSHLKVVDPIFCGAAKQEGFDIRLICQPPNSPDFNILDLGFLSYSSYSIQEGCKNNKRSSFSSPTGKLINCLLVPLFLEQLIYTLIEFLNTCFVGILRVLSMESKHDFCNTSECFEGSHES